MDKYSIDFESKSNEVNKQSVDHKLSHLDVTRGSLYVHLWVLFEFVI